MAQAKKRIVSVKKRQRVDEYPDTSCIGEYKRDDGEHAIDRKERGDMGRNEFQYFHPANPEYAELDYDRAESMNRGDWCYLGLDIVAEITMGGIHQTLESGGLWGVESNAGDYFNEVYADELEAMRGILIDAGFTTRQIENAFKDVGECDE